MHGIPLKAPNEAFYLRADPFLDPSSNWAFPRLPTYGVGYRSTMQFVIKSSPLTLTRAERISDALRKLRRIVESIFGNRILEMSSRRVSIREERDTDLDVLVFRAVIKNGLPEECADASDALIDFIVSHPDSDVQQDLSVEVFGRND
jgi:hypothetical protein